MPPNAVLATLSYVWKLLASLNIPAALMGGMALSIWKYPRFTRDVDLLVAIPFPSLDTVLQQFSAAGIRPKRANPIVKVGDIEFIQLVYEPPDALVDVQIDLLLAKSDYQTIALERRVNISALDIGFDIAVLAREDLIIHKLIAGRMIDLADTAALLRGNQDSLDMLYLEKWVRHFQVEADFKRIWEEAFPGR
jgi:hypothetical protein